MAVPRVIRTVVGVTIVVGLVIAAGADGWDAAEIVGALLFMGERFAGQPALLNQCREKGIKHLEAREAARQAAK